MMRAAWRWAAVVVIAGAFSSCNRGDGSRVEPFLGRVPERQLTGFVLDAEGKPVSGAVVRLVGSGGAAVSGASGRFLFDDPPLGPRLLTLTADAATADATDRLAGFSVRVEVPPGRADLTLPLVVPDRQSGTSRTVALGTQASPIVLDASATAGASLTVPSGANVSLLGGGGSIELNLAAVGREDLPRALPSSATGARLASRGVWLTPVALVLSAGATLTLPNDLGLGVGSRANVFRLDSSTGEWAAIDTGTVQAGGAHIRMDHAVLPGGGLYVATTTIPTTTFVAGRVLDAASKPVRGALVQSMSGSFVRAGEDGRFRLGPLPALDASNQALQLELRALAPVGLEARTVAVRVPAIPTETDAGDLTLATVPVGLLRFVSVLRGHGLVGHAVRAGSASFGESAVAFPDARGKGEIREVPPGWYGGSISWVSGTRFFRGLGRAELIAGNRTVDLELLAREEDPRSAELRGSLFARVVDSASAAPLADVTVQGRHTPDTGDVGSTSVFGEVLVSAERFGDLTASVATERGGHKVIAAYTLGHVDNANCEFDLPVAVRTPAGVFARHGVVFGSLLQSVSGPRTRKMLVRPRLLPDDWWNLQLTGQLPAPTLPRHTDPESTSGTVFRLGVPLGEAAVTAVEGVVVGGVFEPERVGLAVDLEPRAGVATATDIALAFPVDQSLRLVGVLSGLDASIAPGMLRYALGAERPNGTVLDVLPDSGAVLVSGSDGVVRVPSSTGPLEGATWLVAFGGALAQGGVSRSQHVYVEASGPSVTPRGMLALPTITAPSNGSTTAATDRFELRWQIPPGTDFFEVELSSTVGTETRSWRTFFPGGYASFSFQPLVKAAPKIVVADRTWKATVRAYRIARGVAFGRDDGYHRLVGNTFSIRPGARGIDARSTYSIEFKTPK